MTHRDEEVRPYWGEHAEPVGPEPAPLELRPHYSTLEERRQWKIAEGVCPRAACNTELDDEACPRCGWSLLEEQMTARLREAVQDREDYLPTLPAALTIDCYADANLDPEAYA